MRVRCFWVEALRSKGPSGVDSRMKPAWRAWLARALEQGPARGPALDTSEDCGADRPPLPRALQPAATVVDSAADGLLGAVPARTPRLSAASSSRPASPGHRHDVTPKRNPQKHNRWETSTRPGDRGPTGAPPPQAGSRQLPVPGPNASSTTACRPDWRNSTASG